MTNILSRLYIRFITHICDTYIEVKDSRTGYLVHVRDGPGLLPDWESCWDAAVAVAVAIAAALPPPAPRSLTPTW